MSEESTTQVEEKTELQVETTVEVEAETNVEVEKKMQIENSAQVEEKLLELVEPKVEVSTQTEGDVKVEIATPEITEIVLHKDEVVEPPLLLALKRILASDEKQKEFTINIIDALKTHIHTIAAAKPQIFESIEETVKLISSKESVDVKDVPSIMLLLVELYEQSFQQKDKTAIVDLCGNTLKLCIQALVKENLITVNQDASNFILETSNLIDIGVNLIKLNKYLKLKEQVTKKLSSRFKFCFTLDCSKLFTPAKKQQ